MKIYDAPAPNPRRVKMFLAEKGIPMKYEAVNLPAGEHRTGAFLAKNPIGAVPVLELDDGTCISESFAIMNYFEEENPNPPLIGDTAETRMNSIMWDRRMETELLGEVGSFYRHTSPFFAGTQQLPEYAEISAERARKCAAWLDTVLSGQAFIAGSAFTIADITAFVAFDLGTPSLFEEGSLPKNVSRWRTEIGERPNIKGK